MPLFLFAYQLSVGPLQRLFVLGAHLEISGRFGKDEPIHSLYGQLQLIPEQAVMARASSESNKRSVKNAFPRQATDCGIYSCLFKLPEGCN